MGESQPDKEDSNLGDSNSTKAWRLSRSPLSAEHTRDSI